MIKMFVPLAWSFGDVIIRPKILVYYLATHYLEFQTGQPLNLCLLYVTEMCPIMLEISPIMLCA